MTLTSQITTAGKRLLSLFGLLVCACSAQTIPNTPFSSGFENNTVLSPIPTGIANTGGVQNLTGTDLTTGYTWPFLGWNPGSFNVHLDPNISNTQTYPQQFCSSLDTMIDHTGASSKALHLCILASQPTVPNACCIQEMLESNSLGTPLHSYYVRYWAKYPSSMTSQVNQGHYFYQGLGAYKTPYDYRSEWQVMSDGSGGLFYTWEDNSGLNCTGTSGSAPRVYIDPTTGNSVTQTCSNATSFMYYSTKTALGVVPVPINQWFLVELYINRSIGNDGRFYWAVNGQTVADMRGPMYGADRKEVTNMYNVIVYAGYVTGASDSETWVDDILWRDSPPCATLPCGANGTGVTSTVTVTPNFTSPRGYIGTVGVPFSGQITASNAPTSFSVSNLPSGLSVNSSTGAISGTPTSAGNVYATENATNSGGRAQGTVIFQINPTPTSAPTISSFTATPSSITAGQWSQLRWVQNGATTLTLNPGNVNVTGQDPFPVNPATTTTYTLTATNSIGSATATVTVTVTGNPVISSFAASPAPLTPGASTTLSWTTSAATSLTLNPGSINVTATTSRVVTPAVNTTYTLTATNANGSVSSSVTVFLAVRRLGQEAGIQFSNPPGNNFCPYGEYQRTPTSSFGGSCPNFLKTDDIFPTLYGPTAPSQSIPANLVNQYAIKVIWTDGNTYNGFINLGSSTGMNIADVNYQNYYWGDYTQNVTIPNFQTKTGTTVTTSNPLYISGDAWFATYGVWGADVNGVSQGPVTWSPGYPQNATAWSLGWQAFFTAAKNIAPNIRIVPHIGSQDPVVWTNFHTIFQNCTGLQKEHFPLSEPVSSSNLRLQVYNQILNFYWFANVATPVFPNIATEPPTRVTQWGADIDQTVSTQLHSAFALYALSRGTNSFFDLITTGSVTADPTLWQPTATLLGIVNNAGAPTATVIAAGHVLADGWNLMVRAYPGGIAYYNMTGTVQHPVPPPGAKDWVGNPVTSLTLADGQGEVLLTAAVPGPTRISGAILHAISVH